MEDKIMEAAEGIAESLGDHGSLKEAWWRLTPDEQRRAVKDWADIIYGKVIL